MSKKPVDKAKEQEAKPECFHLITVSIINEKTIYQCAMKAGLDADKPCMKADWADCPFNNESKEITP